MDYFEISDSVESVIEEKRSKFITRLYKVFSKKECEIKIDEIKSIEKTASHNCYAFRFLNGTTVVEGRSDDGEPSGTAGPPMLEVLRGNKLINILAITSRYFGGVKLGTGGLVKAYTDGVIKAVECSKLIVYDPKIMSELILDYQKLSKLYNYAKKNIISILSEETVENSNLTKIIFEIPKKEFDYFMKEF